MNKKISIGAAVTYMAIIAAMVYSFTAINSADVFNQKMIDIESRQKLYDSLTEIDRWVRDSYYGDVDDNVLVQGAAQGYINSLNDNYSKYLTPEEYQRYKNVERDQYIGIGVTSRMSEEGFILLTSIYPDSPAYYGNLSVGDLLVEIDGVAVNQENYAELEETLKGASGSKITVVRRNTAGDSTIELIRRDVDIPTVESTAFDNILYIHIFDISSATAKQLERAVNTGISAGQTSFIVDMRGLSSSNLDNVSTMLDIFAPEGDMIFALGSSRSQEVIAVSNVSSISQPVIVLADGDTQGTPEIFVQYIKEMSNGSVVGSTTAGYGSIQEDFKLTDGSAIILTTALYTTPTGVLFNEVGVVPTYDLPWAAEEEEKVFLGGDPETDPQLRKAIEVATAINVTISE